MLHHQWPCIENACFVYERQELDVHLDLMPENLLVIALGVDFAHPRAARQAVYTIALEDAINASVRDFEPMIAFQIPDDPDGPEVIVAAQMQDLLRDCLRRPVRMVVRNRSLVGQPRLAVVCKGMTPSIEAGSPDPEVSAGLADVTRRRSVIQNAQLAPDFLLVFGH